MGELTAEVVRDLFEYEEEAGLLRWKVRRGFRVKPGDVAGTIDNKGYRRVFVDYKNYLCHRIIWLYVYGRWPDGEIDHINHLPDDNRIKNLRVVNKNANSKNRELHSNNPTGHNGVTWSKASEKWQARIAVNKKNIHLGFYSDIGKAVEARMKADIKYGFHVNHGKQERHPKAK